MEFTGTLPYAIMEDYERLACAFYDLRAEPDNETIRMKCLVYAGVLSHYTGDCMMPLHTTKDYDGKKKDMGGFLQKGIHAKIDGFPRRTVSQPKRLAADYTPNPSKMFGPTSEADSGIAHVHREVLRARLNRRVRQAHA